MVREFSEEKRQEIFGALDDIDKFLADGSAFGDRLYSVITDAAECGVGIIITVHSAKLKVMIPCQSG